MIKRFTVKHGLAVSMAVHITALCIIGLAQWKVNRPASLAGMHNEDMPSFRITLTAPIEPAKEVSPEPTDVIAIGGQPFRTDAAALKPPPLPEPPKMLNEIVVSTFAKPKPDSIKNTPPVYPYIAQKEGQEGVVILLVEVNSAGQVNSVEVVQSSGYALLDQSALDAVRKWRFNPATENNQPVLSRVKVPVRFKLVENQ
jgi:protein TonB